MSKSKKSNCCPTAQEIAEIEHLQRVFGVVDLSNWTLTTAKDNITKKARLQISPDCSGNYISVLAFLVAEQ